MRVVLLGGAGTGTSFAIASRLKARWGNEVRLIVTDIFPAEHVTTSLLADRFHMVPKAGDPAFRDRLIDILRAEHVQTYIPVLNEEIALAADLMRLGEFPDIDFWSSPLRAQCLDKVFADQWLAGIGIPTPQKYTVGDQGESWFAKPKTGYGSRGAREVSLDEIEAMTASERDGLLIQEHCVGPEITIDSFYDHQNGFRRAYCRERLETKSGVCTKARLFHDTELSEYAGQIGQALEQCGAICFQVMRGDTGWVVTDLNLRSGAGTAITCSAGFDILAAGYACRIGEDYREWLAPIASGEEFLVTRQYAEFVMRHQK